MGEERDAAGLGGADDFGKLSLFSVFFFFSFLLLSSADLHAMATEIILSSQDLRDF